MADWGNLPYEIATIIAEHLEFIKDFEAFGCVCSSWRSCFKQAKFRAAPLLMLPELDDTSTQRRFYSLHDRKVRSVNIPPMAIYNPTNSKIRLLSSHGWLLSVIEEGKTLCLYNPLSDEVIDLPKADFRLNYGSLYRDEPYVVKFVLSTNPSFSSGFTIALVLNEPYPSHYFCHEFICFLRNSGDEYDDQYWDPLSEDAHRDTRLTSCNDINFYKGNIYGVDDSGTIWCFKLDESDDLGIPQKRKVAKRDEDRLKIIPPGYDDYGPLSDNPHDLAHRKRTVYYLVESDDRLLLVCRLRQLLNKCFRTVSFEVFELNIDNWEAKRVTDLGNVAIFVGSSSSFSTKASISPSIQHNSIYFTDDYRLHYYPNTLGKRYPYNFNSKGVDMGVFHLADASFHKLFRDGPSHYSEYAPYMWLENPQASD